MLSLANDLVARAARLVAATHSASGLWVVSARGRAVGSLTCEAGDWRLAWFDRADSRLRNYAGAVDGDMDTLAEALTLRLGAPVRLEPLSG
jgi:hypothetical protein